MGQNYLNSIPETTEIHLSARNGRIRLKMSPNYVLSESPLAISRLQMPFRSIKAEKKNQIKPGLMRCSFKKAPSGLEILQSSPNLHLYHSLFIPLYLSKASLLTLDPRGKTILRQLYFYLHFLTFWRRAKGNSMEPFFPILIVGALRFRLKTRATLNN